MTPPASGRSHQPGRRFWRAPSPGDPRTAGAGGRIHGSREIEPALRCRPGILTNLPTCHTPPMGGIAHSPLRDADLVYALRSLTMFGAVLHLGAHPDDEDGGMMAYLSRGLGVRAVYWSATRGEGGQNRQGPERGEDANDGVDVGIRRQPAIVQVVMDNDQRGDAAGRGRRGATSRPSAAGPGAGSRTGRTRSGAGAAGPAPVPRGEPPGCPPPPGGRRRGWRARPARRRAASLRSTA